ncbi:MAG: methyltransferase [Pseudomonadota bacterium]
MADRDAAGLSPAQLAFVSGDARQADWPKPEGRPADAIRFKSVLHDWDIGSVRNRLVQAASYLLPGAAVMICERGPVEDEQDISVAALAANLVFSPFYRAPAEYVAILDDLGLRVEDVRCVKLDMTFNIVVARVPS